MLSSRNLLRQALLVLVTEGWDLRTPVSVDESWQCVTCREEEPVLGKVEGGEEVVDLVGGRLEEQLPELSELLKLFGRTTGKL